MSWGSEASGMKIESWRWSACGYWLKLCEWLLPGPYREACRGGEGLSAQRKLAPKSAPPELAMFGAHQGWGRIQKGLFWEAFRRWNRDKSSRIAWKTSNVLVSYCCCNKLPLTQWLKSYKFIIWFSSGGQKSEMDILELKWGNARLSSSWRLFSLPLKLLQAACGPWLLAPFSIIKVSKVESFTCSSLWSLLCFCPHF